MHGSDSHVTATHYMIVWAVNTALIYHIVVMVNRFSVSCRFIHPENMCCGLVCLTISPVHSPFNSLLLSTTSLVVAFWLWVSCAFYPYFFVFVFVLLLHSSSTVSFMCRWFPLFYKPCNNKLRQRNKSAYKCLFNNLVVLPWRFLSCLNNAKFQLKFSRVIRALIPSSTVMKTRQAARLPKTPNRELNWVLKNSLESDLQSLRHKTT